MEGSSSFPPQWVSNYDVGTVIDTEKYQWSQCRLVRLAIMPQNTNFYRRRTFWFIVVSFKHWTLKAKKLFNTSELVLGFFFLLLPNCELRFVHLMKEEYDSCHCMKLISARCRQGNMQVTHRETANIGTTFHLNLLEHLEESEQRHSSRVQKGQRSWSAVLHQPYSEKFSILLKGSKMKVRLKDAYKCCYILYYIYYLLYMILYSYCTLLYFIFYAKLLHSTMYYVILY